MPQSFNCPKCGAPLDYDGGDDLTITCPFCSNSVIVPDELRKHPPQVAGQADKLREIARLARAGQRIEAIKLYRQTFDVRLKEAKDAVERLAAGEVVETTSAEVKPPSSKRVWLAKPRRSSPAEPGGWSQWGCFVVPGILVVLVLLPIVVNFSAIKEDLQSALAAPTRTPTRTPLPAPTQAPTPIPLPTPRMPALAFGGKGTGPGLFTDAHSLAVDGAGNIYVGDWNGGRVQVFDSTGKFVTQWFVGNSKTVISSLATDRKGNVYVVADDTIFRVEGVTGKSLGKLEYPEGDRFNAITLMPNGGLLATWYEERFGLISSIKGHRDDLVRFDAEGKVVQVIRGIVSSQTDDAEVDNHPAVDGLGNIFIAGGTFDTAVFKFTPEGKFVDRFGSRGSEPGQLHYPQAIAVDSQSRVYVADSNGIQIFDTNGRYLDRFKVDGTVYGMVFNDRNELFVVTSTQVMKFRLNQQ